MVILFALFANSAEAQHRSDLSTMSHTLREAGRTISPLQRPPRSRGPSSGLKARSWRWRSKASRATFRSRNFA